MGTVTITRLVSDLSGQEIGESDGETVEFGYRGVSYSIDLTSQEAAEFDERISAYVDNGTRQGGRRRSTAAPKTGDYSAKDVRIWAKSRQIDVPERGRIPGDLLRRYLDESRA